MTTLGVGSSSKPTYEELESNLAQAERAIAEMRGERGCVCILLMACESDVIYLQQQLTESQAQCAAMRRALEAWQRPARPDDQDYVTERAWQLTDAVLAADAGKELLEELQRLREVAQAVKTWQDAWHACQVPPPEGGGGRRLCPMTTRPNPIVRMGALELNLLACCVWALCTAETEEDALRVWRMCRKNREANIGAVDRGLSVSVPVLQEWGYIGKEVQS